MHETKSTRRAYPDINVNWQWKPIAIRYLWTCYLLTFALVLKILLSFFIDFSIIFEKNSGKFDD